MQRVGLYRPREFIKLCIRNTSEFPSLTTKPDITNDGCEPVTLQFKKTLENKLAAYLMALYRVKIPVMALNTRAKILNVQCISMHITFYVTVHFY